LDVRSGPHEYNAAPSRCPFPATRLAQIDMGTQVEVSGGNLTLRGPLPRQGVSLLRLNW
jgi:hypothetical protein